MELVNISNHRGRTTLAESIFLPRPTSPTLFQLVSFPHFLFSVPFLAHCNSFFRFLNRLISPPSRSLWPALSLARKESCDRVSRLTMRQTPRDPLCVIAKLFPAPTSERSSLPQPFSRVTRSGEPDDDDHHRCCSSNRELLDRRSNGVATPCAASARRDKLSSRLAPRDSRVPFLSRHLRTRAATAADSFSNDRRREKERSTSRRNTINSISIEKVAEFRGKFNGNASWMSYRLIISRICDISGFKREKFRFYLRNKYGMKLR